MLRAFHLATLAAEDVQADTQLRVSGDMTCEASCLSATLSCEES